jgi:hypothetical protein
MNELSAVLEPSVELTMGMPWKTTAKIACQAFVYGRTWDEQVNESLAEGIAIVKERERAYHAMRLANKFGHSK